MSDLKPMHLIDMTALEKGYAECSDYMGFGQYREAIKSYVLHENRIETTPPAQADVEQTDLIKGMCKAAWGEDSKTNADLQFSIMQDAYDYLVMAVSVTLKAKEIIVHPMGR